MLLVLVFYFRTQPVIPLFYTLPQRAQQLAPKEWLFLFPISIAFITALHLSLVQTFSAANRLLLQLFSWTTILIQVMFALALVRIVGIIVWRMLLLSLLPLLAATLLAAAVTPLIIKWYESRGWVDDPTQHHHVKVVHSRPLPRGGGLVVFVAFVVTAVLFLKFDQYLIAITISALLLTIVGTLDDIYDIHPFIRLITGFGAAAIVVASGIGIAYVSNPFGPGVIHLDQPQLHLEIAGRPWTIWILADIFALFFIVWNMNIVNWAKGVDGQMPGFVAIAIIFIGLLSQRFQDDPTQINLLTLSLIVAGAFIGFLIWNFFPQKILAGYGAGSLGGFFLSVLAILSGAKVATMLMVLAIPTADAVFTIARRLRAGKSPWWGDRGHLHHKLMDVLGWGKRRVAIFYWITSLVMGILSLYLNTTGKLITIMVSVSLVFGFLVWAKYRQTQPAKMS